MQTHRTRIAASHPISTERLPHTYRSAHPALRDASHIRSDTSGRHGSRGASAAEVDAVAHLIESFAPGTTVRAVSRKGGVYVVKAAVSGRGRLYRIPVDMVPRGRVPAPPVSDRAA